jgi:hypothetical protein
MQLTNNVMEHKIRVLTAQDESYIKEIRDIGLELYELFTEIGPSREISIAKGKVEEAVMWAIKSIKRIRELPE